MEKSIPFSLANFHLKEWRHFNSKFVSQKPNVLALKFEYYLCKLRKFLLRFSILRLSNFYKILMNYMEKERLFFKSKGFIFPIILTSETRTFLGLYSRSSILCYTILTGKNAQKWETRKNRTTLNSEEMTQNKWENTKQNSIPKE